MKNYFYLLLFFLYSFACYAQEQFVTPPKDGHAVVYFVRTNGAGAMVNFRLFDKGTLIGKLKGSNNSYIRYECTFKETVFWIKSENIDFVEADLKDGGIYIIEVRPTMGAFYAAVKLKLVDYNDEKQMKRINRVLEKKNSYVASKEKLEKDQEKMMKAIIRGSKIVQKKRKKDKNIKRLTKDMTYPSFLE